MGLFARFSKQKVEEPELGRLLGAILSYMKVPLLARGRDSLSGLELCSTLNHGRVIPNFYGNSIRSACYMIESLESLGFKREELKQPVLGALLHDLGKLDNIKLYQKRDFSEQEMEQRKKHPLDSKERILELSNSLDLASEIALGHHFLGDKYPTDPKLSPRALFFSGVLGIIDCYDAASTRPLLLSTNPNKLNPRELLEEKFGQIRLVYENRVNLVTEQFISDMYRLDIFGRAPAINPYDAGHFTDKLTPAKDFYMPEI